MCSLKTSLAALTPLYLPGSILEFNIGLFGQRTSFHLHLFPVWVPFQPFGLLIGETEYSKFI